MDSSFWKIAAAVLGAVSFLKGLRRPNLWSATQAMVNYDHGIVKRGFFGATLGRWFRLNHYARFSVVSFVLLALLIGLLVLLTGRSGVWQKVGFGESVAVFFSSFTITFMAHLVGYLDIPLAIVALSLLLIRNTTLRFAAAVPLCVMALLIHELFLIVFLPVVLLSFVLDALRATSSSKRTAAWAMAGVLAVISLSVAAKLSVKRPLTLQGLATLKTEIGGRADFPVKNDFFDVMVRSGGDNWKVMAAAFHGHGVSHDLFLAKDLVLCAPTLFLLLVVIGMAVKRSSETGARRTLALAVSASLIAPMGMHLIAWDAGRFDALATLNVFFVLLVVCRTLPAERMPNPVWFRNAAILVIALNMATGETLMDGEKINVFPFVQSTKDLMHSARQNGWTPPSL